MTIPIQRRARGTVASAVIVSAAIVSMVTSLGVDAAPHGGGRAGGHGGGAHAQAGTRPHPQVNNNRADVRTNNVRSTSVNNVNANRNINVDRNVNVNVDVDHRGCCGHWDDDWHPVATAAAVTATAAVTSAVIGSIVRTLPPACVPVNYRGMIYQQCGSTWYAPQGAQFVVVAAPY